MERTKQEYEEFFQDDSTRLQNLIPIDVWSIVTEFISDTKDWIQLSYTCKKNK